MSIIIQLQISVSQFLTVRFCAMIWLAQITKNSIVKNTSKFLFMCSNFGRQSIIFFSIIIENQLSS